MEALPTVSDVIDASVRLQGIVSKTPLIRSEALESRLGRPVFVKCEPLQLTGSFKIRGAYNRLSRLTDEQRPSGVVAFSSGNHAQGVARAARLLSVPATIVMPHDTPEVKIEGVRQDGADIVFYDRQTESREDIAARLAEQSGAVLVPSYDDVHVIAGQGTAGLEVCEAWPLERVPETLVCCVGGGGLIAGVGLAVKDKWPDLKICGAEPAAFDDHARSLVSGERETNAPEARSICDALLSPSPGKLTFAINQKNLSGVGCVSDDEVREAMRFAFRHLKVVVEPGGAAALAAAIFNKIEHDGDGPLIIFMTGGNVDPSAFARILAG